MIDRANESAHAASFHAKVAEIFLRFGFAQVHQLALDLRADDDRLGGEMVARVLLDGQHVLQRRVRFHRAGNRSEIALGHVAGEERRLRAEQEKFARDQFLFRRELKSDRRFSGVEMRQELVHDSDFGLRAFRSGPDFFLQTVVPFLERREIGQDQLGVDDFDVANRIDCPADVMNVGVFETTHHLHDRVDLANVTEELVAQTFARTRAFHEPRDVHKFDRGRDDFLRMRKLRENFEA